MHPTLDEMLALREGSASPDVIAHVAVCERCRSELETLDRVREELWGLPQLQPPPASWDTIRTAVRHRRQLQRRGRWAVVAAALIAGVALWFLVVEVDVSRPGAISEVTESLDVDELIAASGQLERALQVPSLQSRVLTPHEAAEIVVIEDQIALIDLRLARSSDEFPRRQAVELWSDRVELLDELVQARGGMTARGFAHTASFDEERSWR
jgi:hypothetical protein